MLRCNAVQSSCGRNLPCGKANHYSSLAAEAARIKRYSVLPDMPKVVRRATHAGTWYKSDATDLLSTVSGWLREASGRADCQARAVISPHAGHIYCGHVMAQAFSLLDVTDAYRVFVLGPSHHLYSSTCLLSAAETYRSPIGEVHIDQEVYATLDKTDLFQRMDLQADEAEHSLELQLPFIQTAMRGKPFTLVPILVGALHPSSHAVTIAVLDWACREAVFGRTLAPYLDDPGNLFVISSDFCHWGSRFRYTHHDPSAGQIYQSIEQLDRKGMAIIEQGKPEAFTAYLKQYGNTICGRHPIAVFLNMLQHCRTAFTVKFNCYDQSSRCTKLDDSSVSYAAATAVPIAS